MVYNIACPILYCKQICLESKPYIISGNLYYERHKYLRNSAKQAKATRHKTKLIRLRKVRNNTERGNLKHRKRQWYWSSLTSGLCRFFYFIVNMFYTGTYTLIVLVLYHVVFGSRATEVASVRSHFRGSWLLWKPPPFPASP